MNLTREQAIAEHRKMWNCIADVIEKEKDIKIIVVLKRNYCISNKFGEVYAYCFLCEYVKNNTGCTECKDCPLEWWGISCINSDESGLYNQCKNAETWQEQATLARQIANLPERTDV